MKITLRKSKALQSAILEQMEDIFAPDSVNIGEFEDLDSVMVVAKSAHESYVNQYTELNGVFYELRKLTSDENYRSGVSETLSNVAMVEKRIIFLVQFSKAKPALEQTLLSGKIAKLSLGDTTGSYGRSVDSVSTGILSQGAIDIFKTNVSDLKKEKIKLQDHLVNVNSSAEIEVSEHVEKVLTKHNLI
jgi:hypothetical protein